MIYLLLAICTTGISLSRNHSYIHECGFYVQFAHSTSPWESRPLLTWRPPAVTRVVLLSPRLLVNCPLVPHCSPLFPASLPSGLPQNPNVLLIRTHPNPSPSVANRKAQYLKAPEGLRAWNTCGLGRKICLRPTASRKYSRLEGK